ncbi:hypothetical protein F9L16_05280 [Agarivorans sp. B2Z047]|uniref:hypothetical protein n=1 Tax=Agarivorans sp. B2Z047 TaxID=2652721 RepID=UPI00128DAA15|nr:hypothetical protein [Agarivorans sp. B2Z047]MPW28413.1 hypothetical protein [Agarivorans sp. B2Z047]UQN43766.1 hypothetical protein LQZ07_04660 [Agarivorans sp. B2Z047]
MDKQRKEGIERVEQKLKILETWVNTEIPYLRTRDGLRIESNAVGEFKLEYFPKSVSALRRWNGHKNSFEVVEKFAIPHKITSTETYKASPTYLRERIEGNCTLESIFERLKNKALLQTQNRKSTEIKNLKRALNQAENNHKAIAHELISIRLENQLLTERCLTYDLTIKGLKKQHAVEIEWRNTVAVNYQEKLLALESTNNQLRQTLLDLSEREGISIELEQLESNIIDFTGGNQ